MEIYKEDIMNAYRALPDGDPNKENWRKFLEFVTNEKMTLSEVFSLLNIAEKSFKAAAERVDAYALIKIT